MTITRAVWKGQVLAETTSPVMVDGNTYYPGDSLRMEFFEPIDQTTVCGWKGTASYYNVKSADGEVMTGGAWYYADPKPAAAKIKGHVAFYPFVQHVKSD